MERQDITLNEEKWNGDHLRTGRGRKGENWEAVTTTPSLQFRFGNLEFVFGLSLSYVLVS